MENKTLLNAQVKNVTLEEIQEAAQANSDLIRKLHTRRVFSFSLVGILTILVLVNVALYFLLKNVSPSYLPVKLIFANILVLGLIILILRLVVRFLSNRQQETPANNDMQMEENNAEYAELTLREHNFTYGASTYDWKNLTNYATTNEWMFLMVNNKVIIPVKIDSLTDAQRAELLQILSGKTEIRNDERIDTSTN